MYGQIYILKIQNPDSKFHGHYYIGQHKGDVEKDNYWGSGKKIRSYLSHWGTFGIIREVLDIAESASKLDDLEAKYITQETLQDPFCMNLVTGGNAKKKFSESSIQLLKEAGRKGGLKSNASEESRKMRSGAMKKFHANMNEKERMEYIAKISGANHDNAKTPENKLYMSVIKLIRNDIKKGNTNRFELIRLKISELIKMIGSENDDRVKKVTELYSVLITNC